MWFPSFLAFPISLPSLPSISLPANIQRRFLSYVLKRALGRFVVASGLDVERIQAQISQGLVELDRLEVNTDEINGFIPDGLPFTVVSGEVAKVTARVPFPNLWSDSLSLTVDSLTLVVTISPPSTKVHSASTSHLSAAHLDLASSVTSAADDFVHDELDAFEGAALDRSIRESLVLTQTDPFSRDSVPGAFPPFVAGPGPESSPIPVETTTVLTSLVERILARLEMKVRNIRVRVRYEDDQRSGLLELRVGEVRYADETPEEVTGPRKRVRAVTISSVGIYLLPMPPTPTASPQAASPGLRPSFSRSSSSSTVSSDASSESSDSADEYHDMAMSQAVHDLRQSTMTSASGQSIYHSMAEDEQANEPLAPLSPVMERVGAPIPDARPSRLSSGGSSRSATPTVGPSESNETLLLSFGSEDIVMRMTTTAATVTPTSPTTGSPVSPALPWSPQHSQPSTSSASVEIELSVGTIAGVFLPAHTAFLLAAAQAAVGKPSSPKQQPDSRSLGEAVPAQPRLEAKVKIKGTYLAFVYDLNHPAEDYESVVAQFFARPSAVNLPLGHLRLRLEEVVSTYQVPSFSGLPARSKRDGSRKGIPTPKPPIVTVTIADMSIFEYVASAEAGDDEPPGGSFPVLLFDGNLPRQYDVAPGASWGAQASHARANLPSFPEFDSVDWRNAGVQKRSGEKTWRVKPKGRGILRNSASPEPSGLPVVTLRKELNERESGSLSLLPVHVFLDLSLVERLLPVLRFLAPLIKSTSETPPSPPPTFPSRPPLAVRTRSSIIEDLEARPVFSSRSQPATIRTILTVRCPMIRLDIRCPAPPNRRGSWGDGAHLRSGIVTLDVHGLNLKVTQGQGGRDLARPTRRLSEPRDPQEEEGISVEWQKMVFLFSRVPEKRSVAFLVIGPLAPEHGENYVLLPMVNVHSDIAPSTGLKTQSVTCRIPSVQAQIRQPTVEGLQFFADDMTHWLDGAFGDGSAPRPRDDLKMIGSRFFGSKASSSASSSMVDEEDEPGATLLRVLISECELALVVPKALRKEQGSETSDRILSLHASDVDVKLESSTTSRQETSITLTAMDASLFHHPDPDSTPSRIFGRTTSLNFAANTPPLINLRFSSTTHADRTKETGIRLTASSCGVFVTKDLDWISDLKLFIKTPEGVFEDVVPSEVTRIYLLLNDCSARVDTPTLPGALVAVASVMEVRTAMESEADESQIDIGLTGLHILAVDDLAATTDLADIQSSFQNSLDAWKRAGYAPLIEVETMDAQVIRSLLPVETVLVDVVHVKVSVTACADSIASFGALAGDLPKLVPSSPAPTEQRRRQMALDQSIDVFGSIDLEAFNQAPDIVSGADMIEDDLPTNLDYLDHEARQSQKRPAIDRKTGETLRSWETPDEAFLVSESQGATIKVLMAEPFDDPPDYWETLPVLKNGDETRPGKTRVRVQNCAVGVYLHDGYDWQRTRKEIEDEIKAVRRRLERIKQMLATGQKADASMDEAGTMLFNSVYIGLPDHDPDGMDSAQLMAAIDDELEDLGVAETATESSWQPFPDAGYVGGKAAATPKKSHMRLHGKRLTRSKRAQMEFSLSDLRAELDIYAPDDATASRVHVTAGSFEILDHIKTSTWKKFLTEMRSDSRGNVRETDADMVRIELVNVRPNLPFTDEEIRLKAKILPLRLHVDQDALDFLKQFFSFQSSGRDTAEPASKAEPFFQFVEIMPVELKLDYKPKHVDFAALGQGRMAELMNFFHFDGAEMTLRHITLSGVTGATRLSDMLQDIWTPDVKYNQLADVLSGVSTIRSVVNIGSGMADLILLPIQQYRKDGRFARGLRQGGQSFARSSGLEMVKLGARLATGTQVILERAEGVLGNKLSDSVIVEATETASDDEGKEERSRYANQPSNVREGLKGAYTSLSSNLNSAAQTILAVPMEVYERSGEGGPMKAVVRAVPIAVLKPMIGATEAVSKTLFGLHNTLDPNSQRDLGDKYK